MEDSTFVRIQTNSKQGSEYILSLFAQNSRILRYSDRVQADNRVKDLVMRLSRILDRDPILQSTEVVAKLASEA